MAEAVLEGIASLRRRNAEAKQFAKKYDKEMREMGNGGGKKKKGLAQNLNTIKPLS